MGLSTSALLSGPLLLSLALLLFISLCRCLLHPLLRKALDFCLLCPPELTPHCPCQEPGNYRSLARHPNRKIGWAEHLFMWPTIDTWGTGLSWLFRCFFVETGSCCAAQAGLKLKIPLLQPPKCWDYRCAPPLPAFPVYKEAP
jgi:hypothetical protein